MMEYYTTVQAAELLGLHRNTILKHIDRGEMPAVKVGRNYRIPAEWLDRYMEAIADALTVD